MDSSVEYDLAHTHPEYRHALPAGFNRLKAKWPQAKLNKVGLFDPKSDDLSIGNVDELGVIKLSMRWFGQDPKFLQQAALAEPRFHGPLTKQPEQAIAHEFGHCLLDGLGKNAQKRNLECWDKATRDPTLTPGPYALAADGNEYFSELFAALDLGVITTSQRRALDYIIGRT